MTKTTSLIKPAGLTLLLYIALSVLSSIVLTGFWQAGIDTTSMTNQELMLLAESSAYIKTGSAIIGAACAILCAFILSLKKTPRYRPALVFAAMLILYGALSIVLHPEHTALQQVSKIVMPVPLCLLGAWLAHRFHAFRAGSGVAAIDTP